MQRHEQPHTPARAALLEAERRRRDLRLRAATWDPEQWTACLAACAAEEQRRDAALVGLMVGVPAADPRQREAAHALLAALEDDVSWYRWFGFMLGALRERWHVTPDVSRAMEEELAEHERAVALRRAERESRVQLLTQALRAQPAPSPAG